MFFCSSSDDRSVATDYSVCQYNSGGISSFLGWEKFTPGYNLPELCCSWKGKVKKKKKDWEQWEACSGDHAQRLHVLTGIYSGLIHILTSECRLALTIFDLEMKTAVLLKTWCFGVCLFVCWSWCWVLDSECIE